MSPQRFMKTLITFFAMWYHKLNNPNLKNQIVATPKSFLKSNFPFKLASLIWYCAISLPLSAANFKYLIKSLGLRFNSFKSLSGKQKA